MNQPPDEQLHFKLKIPAELHRLLKIEAAKNKRTLSQEILKRVEDSFSQATIDELEKIAALIVATIEKRIP